MRRFISYLAVIVPVLSASIAVAAGKAEHIVVIVWDGMRRDCISKEHTPTLWKMTQEGVMFANHHPVYPSSTEVNGAAIATGAYPQNSGIIANREFRPEINPRRVVDTQNADVIARGDQLHNGHYLMRATVAETLQAAGRKTVIAGTKPVAQLHDRRPRPDDYRIGVTLFDGKVLPSSLQASLNETLGRFPPAASPSSLLPNEPRDDWTTRALIGPLWSNGVPTFSLLWLSEPDFSQHPTSPGSPKSLAALASSDRKLAAVWDDLERRNLRDKTDVFVVSDHGFSTIERGVDVCAALQNAGFSARRAFTNEPGPGDILVNGLGGSVFFYVTGHEADTTRKLIDFLQQQTFTGVIFAQNNSEGTFPLTAANINSTQPPDVAISLRWTDLTNKFGVPGFVVIETSARFASGGTHASLSPFDMRNTLVGAGPDLKAGFTDTLPTGNTDLASTILWLLDVKPKGPMDGRVLSEALTVDGPRTGEVTTRRLETTRRVLEKVTWSQYLQISRVNDTVYLDEGNGALIKQ